jgi:hypothetical protein
MRLVTGGESLIAYGWIFFGVTNLELIESPVVTNGSIFKVLFFVF